MSKKIIFCCLLLLENICQAGYEKSQSELTKIRSDINSTQQAMERITLQKTNLQNQLAEIDKRYGEITAILRALQAQVDQQRRNLIAIQQEIVLNQGEINQQNTELAGQVKAAYAMGQQERLKLMLNQQDPALSGRMMVYYDYLNKARLKKIDDIKAAVKRLGSLEKQKRIESEQLSKNLKQKKTEQNLLNTVKNQRNSLLTQLTKEFSSSQQQLIHFRENEYKLGHLMTTLRNLEPIDGVEMPEKNGNSKPEAVNQLNGDDFSKLKGKLLWPVKGKLVKSFGSSRSGGGTWDGVLIQAEEGSDIHAVAKGKVVFANWLRGYGLLIILDHDQGYMSLYAFNQSLFKQVGDIVEVGDVIAYVGQSGGRNQSGLYFGIRSQGIAVNPSEWCKK